MERVPTSMLFVDLTSQLNRVAEIAMLIFGLALVALVLLAKGGGLRDRMLQLALGPYSPSEQTARWRLGLGPPPEWARES